MINHLRVMSAYLVCFKIKIGLKSFNNYLSVLYLKMFAKKWFLKLNGICHTRWTLPPKILLAVVWFYDCAKQNNNHIKVQSTVHIFCPRQLKSVRKLSSGPNHWLILWLEITAMWPLSPWKPLQKTRTCRTLSENAKLVEFPAATFSSNTGKLCIAW